MSRSSLLQSCVSDLRFVFCLRYHTIIGSLGRYRVGAIIWDQAEADLSCNHTAQFACLQRGLVSSWRSGLGGAATGPSATPVVAVQLPGYMGDCKQYCPDLINMRLAQEAGFAGDVRGAVSATYDLSCPHCPFGSVHNTHKTSVGTPSFALGISTLLAVLFHFMRRFQIWRCSSIQCCKTLRLLFKLTTLFAMMGSRAAPQSPASPHVAQRDQPGSRGAACSGCQC